ncbi:MAG: D-cysteine desulfhydrase family protein [Bacillota bacterium]|jgi:D-cysteine desulfhydrase family pyridoxal phosphate-dependent enzyme
MRVGSLPRVRLAHLPTPFEEARCLSRELGFRVFLKRDDQTGLATGGNKARKLEFLMGDAVTKGADVVITTGALQSNHARQTAAAAARLGMRCVLVLTGNAPSVFSGNLLLDRFLGAEVALIGKEDPSTAMEEIAREVEARGRTPYIIPLGGSSPVGAAGYVLGMLELFGQAAEAGITIGHIVTAVGSAGTIGGILVGTRLLDPAVKVTGISVGRSSGELARMSADVANRTSRLLDLPLGFKEEDLTIFDGYVGEGYAIPTAGCWDAIRKTASWEGVILDPVYTGKAMAGLMDLGARHFDGPGCVVFLHTGGTAALFAMAEDIPEAGGQGIGRGV